MIPKHLSFQAFGPYLQKQEIDFAPLAEAGLFLISGETGAGKTAILDAMTYALFGRSSGDTRGDIAGMRSDFAPDDVDTDVEFIFALGEKEYKFTRSVRVHVKKSGEKEFRVAQAAFFRSGNGEWEPFFENPKIRSVQEKAEELLGLTYDQFSQVIMLPQGKFERLLVAGSAEKEEILSRLFHTGKWDDIVQNMVEDARERGRECERLEAAIEGIFAQFGVADMEELKAALEKLKQEKQACAKETEEAASKLGAAKKALDGAMSADKVFAEREMAEKELAALRVRQVVFDQWTEMLRRADDAEKVQPLREAALKRKAEAEARKEEWNAAGKKMAVIEQAIREDGGVICAHIAWMERERMLLEGGIAAQEEALAWADEKYGKVMERYLGSMAYALGETLEDGKPCPVCGSTQHPQVAGKEADAAGAEDVQAAEKYAQAQKKKLEMLRRELEGLLRQQEDCAGVLGDAGLERQDAVAKKMADNSVMRALREAAQQQAAARERVAAAEKTYCDAKGAFESEMEYYRKECLRLGFENDEQVKKYAIGAEEAEKIKKQADEYRVNLQAAEKRALELDGQIKGKKRPDVQAAQNGYMKAEEMRRQADVRLAQMAAREEQMAAAEKKADKDGRRREQMRAVHEEMERFAKLLRGDIGVGIKRYVLGVMLSAVTGEANRLLKQVHGGRYELFRSAEGSGRARKVGLELEVFDSHTGERRGVASLSGGEKFLVSLALSLGLSAVVQAQSGGIRMDAMFIDEGFGSLDPASIEDALRILAHIRGGTRMVGIISHVQMLKETIDAAIRVEKTRLGSALHVTI